MGKIQLLDCTLRDGAYIVNSEFGTPAIKGIIGRMQEANVDIVECGWLKDPPHREGCSYFHVPSDLERYLGKKSQRSLLVAMIDWDRYDLSALPPCDGKSIDAIRVVFPYAHFREGIEVGKEIAQKGYRVFFQAANTLQYSDEDLKELADCINEARPVSLSVVDTFGAMYHEDVERIVKVLDARLDPSIKLGFHSHNNQQLSFSLTQRFIELLCGSARDIVVDSSLCGMGRGAGNTTTELLANYLNLKHHANYDMNVIMDAIDVYMQPFLENFKWGYSIPYFIAGMYCCHVNNIAYLLKNHRTNARDMRNIIGSLSPEERRHYDYDLLESKYLENQSRVVNDKEGMSALEKAFGHKNVLLIAPGRSTIDEEAKIKKFIEERRPIVLGVNAVNARYALDYLILTNRARYDYARTSYREEFEKPEKILLSNVKTEGDGREIVINFDRIVKRGWEHFDNAVILTLRLLEKLQVKEVAIAGFDGFKHKYAESYADPSLPILKSDGKWDELNAEILEMFRDFCLKAKDLRVEFVTESIFDGARK